MRKLTPQVGERHGLRTITAIDLPSPDIHQRVKVECACGAEAIVAYTALRNGKVKACYSCAQRHDLAPYEKQIGERIGKRTIKSVFRDRNDQIRFMLECVQGHEVSIFPTQLATFEKTNCLKCASKEAQDSNDERRASVLALKARGHKQTEIAKMLGYTPSMITLIVQGKR